MNDLTPTNIRERVVVTKVDMSGDEPKLIEELEVVTVNGRVVARTVERKET